MRECASFAEIRSQSRESAAKPFAQTQRLLADDDRVTLSDVGEAAGRKVWEVTQADYDRNVAYYTPTNSTSPLAAGGARHRPV